MTNAELAILSLIVEQPRHGYEIEQVIGERGMREWTEIGFSSIYYLLKKLEQEGLVTGRLEETHSGPARKVYHSTSAGEAALQAGVLEALSGPEPHFPPMQLGLANFPAIPSNQALAALRQYYTTLSAQRESILSNRKLKEPIPYFIDATFDYSITMISAEMQWIEKFIHQVEESSSREEE